MVCCGASTYTRVQVIRPQIFSDSTQGGSVYAASKHAMHAFAKSLRYETYDKNIRCTVVAPGLVGEGTEFSEVIPIRIEFFRAIPV